MQKNLYIFVQLPDGRRSVAGRLLYEKLSDGQIQSYFRYEPSWQSRSDAFSLDPVNLPLEKTVFQLKSRTGLWGVLEDALPDAWGRRLLQARHAVDVSQSNNIELLRLTGWAEPGATGFADTSVVPDRLVVPMDLAMTDQAIIASEAFERDKDMILLPDFFISGGSSVGGARPKVLACSGENHFLIKFPSINDPSPEIMAQLEFFGMSCARYAGVPVPDFFPVRAASQRMALAVQRFDTTGTQGRRHFLSFQSLVGVEEQLGFPYAGMANIIKKISGNPENDLQNLYKQMVVNVIICNCDDHLKNFSMLYDPAMQQFSLSPAYDVVPNLWQREHILSIAGKTLDISSKDLLHEGKGFSLSRHGSLRLLNEAVQGVAQAFNMNKDMLQQLASTHSLCRQLLAAIEENISAFKP